MTRPGAKGESKQSRRGFLLRAGAAATGLVFSSTLLPRRLPAAGPLLPGTRPLRGASRIGIIGSGNIGGAVGLKWAEAGHEILFSSRHPEELTELVERAGPRTRAGLPQRPPLSERSFSSRCHMPRSPRWARTTRP